MGGLRVLPDYDLKDMPEDYAGLILIGGMRWFSPEAELIVPLVKKALKDKKLVAGICNASVFLGMHVFFNEIKHTNVRDENIVTANGIGQLEFCREVLYALEADTAEAIEESFLFYKNWFCPEQ